MTDEQILGIFLYVSITVFLLSALILLGIHIWTEILEVLKTCG